MVLSTKARRVSVGARAGNARRSALRPRMRGAVPERGPGRPGRGPVPKEPGSGRRRKRGPGLRPEGRPERPTPGNSVPKDVLPSPKLRGAVARGAAASRTRAEDTRRRLGPGAAPKAGGTPTPGNVLRRAGLRVRATRGATGEQSLKARLRGLPARRAGDNCRRTRRPALRLRECRRAGPALFRGNREYTPERGGMPTPGTPAGLRPEQPTPGAHGQGIPPGKPGRPPEGDPGSAREAGRTPGGKHQRRKARANARSSEALPPPEGLPLPRGRTGRTPEDLLRRAGLRIQSLPRGDRGQGFKALTTGASALIQVPETPLRDAEAGAADQKNRSPRAARKKSKPLPKHRSSIPCPGTFRKRNTLP